MDLKQGRALMALYAVDVFIDGHKAKLPKTSGSGARARLSRGLDELTLYIRNQEAAALVSKQLTQTKKAKRTTLIRDFMTPIARMAKLESSRVPELQPLKTPRGEPGVEKLLGHAAGMLVVVSQHVELFVELGMSPTVVEDMLAAIDAVIGSITDRKAQVGQRAGATKGVGRMIVALNKQKDVLDSFVRSELKDSPSVLAIWKLVKRAEPLPGRRRKASALKAPANKQLGAGTMPISNPQRLLASPM